MGLVTININESVKEQIRTIKEKENKSYNQILRDMIKKYIE